MKRLFFILIFLLIPIIDKSTNGYQKLHIESTYVVYSLIKFDTLNKLNFNVFKYGYVGYLKMKNKGLIDKSIITICDFNLPSYVKRMWVIDLYHHKVLYNTYVAHGENTGNIVPEKFSNKINSHKSSIGFYITDETYQGTHGLQLRLDGKDKGYNDNARCRGIVFHGSDYVSKDVLCNDGKIGTSWGCPAVSNNSSCKIIEIIKNKTCFFIYANNREYLESSIWLNSN